MRRNTLTRAQREHLNEVLKLGRHVVVEFHVDENGIPEFHAMYSYDDKASAEHMHLVITHGDPSRTAELHHPEKTK